MNSTYICQWHLRALTKTWKTISGLSWMKKVGRKKPQKNLANSFDGLHKMYLVVEHFILWLRVIKSKKTRMHYNKNSLILIKTIKDFAYIFIAFILRVSSWLLKQHFLANWNGLLQSNAASVASEKSHYLTLFLRKRYFYYCRCGKIVKSVSPLWSTITNEITLTYNYVTHKIDVITWLYFGSAPNLYWRVVIVETWANVRQNVCKN